LSFSLLSLFIGHLISDAIAANGLLLSGIMVPRIDVRHRDSLRPRRRRTSRGLTKKMTAEEKNDLMQKLAELYAEDANDNESVPPHPTPV
jgi:hypothetical protein